MGAIDALKDNTTNRETSYKVYILTNSLREGTVGGHTYGPRHKYSSSSFLGYRELCTTEWDARVNSGEKIEREPK